MFEVEVKVRADHERVRRELESLGATREGVVVQEDTYFDAPHRAFGETDEALRIREQAEGVEFDAGKDVDVEALPESTFDDAEARVTYKGPLVDHASKTREEHETEVASGDAMRAILAGLGFAEVARVSKVRERYLVAGVTVTLDDVAGLGEFVEVELEVESESDVPGARERAFGLLRDLGLDPEDQIRASYLGLLLD